MSINFFFLFIIYLTFLDIYIYIYYYIYFKFSSFFFYEIFHPILRYLLKTYCVYSLLYICDKSIWVFRSFEGKVKCFNAPFLFHII
jgi:hypothetical protein